jgi:hypothetical protein
VGRSVRSLAKARRKRKQKKLRIRDQQLTAIDLQLKQTRTFGPSILPRMLKTARVQTLLGQLSRDFNARHKIRP